MLQTIIEKPKLAEPFPDIPEYWTCEKTGLMVPKHEVENLRWRERILKESENDVKLQKDRWPLVRVLCYTG